MSEPGSRGRKPQIRLTDEPVFLDVHAFLIDLAHHEARAVRLADVLCGPDDAWQTPSLVIAEAFPLGQLPRACIWIQKNEGVDTASVSALYDWNEDPRLGEVRFLEAGFDEELAASRKLRTMDIAPWFQDMESCVRFLRSTTAEVAPTTIVVLEDPPVSVGDWEQPEADERPCDPEFERQQAFFDLSIRQLIALQFRRQGDEILCRWESVKEKPAA